MGVNGASPSGSWCPVGTRRPRGRHPEQVQETVSSRELDLEFLHQRGALRCREVGQEAAYLYVRERQRPCDLT